MGSVLRKASTSRSKSRDAQYTRIEVSEGYLIAANNTQNRLAPSMGGEAGRASGPLRGVSDQEDAASRCSPVPRLASPDYRNFAIKSCTKRE